MSDTKTVEQRVQLIRDHTEHDALHNPNSIHVADKRFLFKLLDDCQAKLTRQAAVVEAARHWALWHTLYSHGRPDEPEEIELKEALEQADE